jgi:hypothetical protein
VILELQPRLLVQRDVILAALDHMLLPMVLSACLVLQEDLALQEHRRAVLLVILVRTVVMGVRHVLIVLLERSKQILVALLVFHVKLESILMRPAMFSVKCVLWDNTWLIQGQRFVICVTRERIKTLKVIRSAFLAKLEWWQTQWDQVFVWDVQLESTRTLLEASIASTVPMGGLRQLLPKHLA